MRAKILLPPFILIVASQAAAQSVPPQVHLGGSFIVAEPQQEFANYVNTSLGGSINALWTPWPESVLGFRFEGGVISYGRETRHIPFSSRANRVDVRQTTSNMIAFVHAGPQFTWTRGLVRPYIAPSAGLTYIATMTSLNGDGEESFASNTHQKDANLSFGATAGVYVDVLRGRVPVALDLSTRYTRNGIASYLIEGSIQDNPDGSISFDPIRSSTNLLTFHIGVSVGIVDDDTKSEDYDRD
jgi:hypothetical protein